MEQQYRQRLRTDADSGNKIAERLLLNTWLAESNQDEITALLARYEKSGDSTGGKFLEAELSCFHNWSGEKPWHKLLHECVDAGHREAQLVSSLYHEWARQSGKLPSGEQAKDGMWQDGWRAWAPPEWITIADKEGVKIERSTAFASRALLGILRAILGPQLRPSAVIDPQSGKTIAHPIRINRSAQWLPEHLGWIGKLYECRLAETCRYEVSHGEALNLLHYQPEQRYKAHLDCIGNEQAASPEGQLQGGQRTLTVLLAMGNDDFAGGQTYFPRLKKGAKAATGELLRFNNTDANGKPLPASLHEGSPVETGEKWLLSKWVRQLPTPYGQEIGLVCPAID